VNELRWSREHPNRILHVRCHVPDRFAAQAAFRFGLSPNFNTRYMLACVIARAEAILRVVDNSPTGPSRHTVFRVLGFSCVALICNERSHTKLSIWSSGESPEVVV
jgi:hypothetical protein